MRLNHPRLALLLTLCLIPVGAAAMPCPDADSDGYADCSVPGCDSTGLTCGDCDDGAAQVNPGALDGCNHVDDDCDGRTDEDFPGPATIRTVVDGLGEGADNFGWRVDAVGDVDSDDIADFAVSAYRDDTSSGVDAGSVLLYSGADLGLICRMVDPAGSTSDRLGASLAGIGDVTGDGVPDIAAGATSEDTRASGAGAILVFSGADCSFHMRLTDPDGATNDAMGGAVAGLADITGDGVPEILAGVDQDNVGSLGDAGSVVVFNGADGSVVFKLVDPNGGQSDRLGAAVAGLGDVNGDGTADIAAGSFSDDTAGGGAGSVLLFSGADGSLIRKILDPQAGINDNLGTSLARIADMNNDGVDDIVAGAPLDNSGGVTDGGAALIFSAADGSLIRRMVDPDRAQSDRLGVSVAALPDIDGDGLSEVVAGANLDDTGGGNNAGSVLIFSGATGAVLHKLTDPEGDTSDELGRWVAVLPDISGDGAADIAVGAPIADRPEGTTAGRLLLFSFDSDCDGDGVTPFGLDCDDNDGNNYTGNLEVCDGQDNDCDTAVDEDEDGDSFDACSDCATQNPLIYPGAPERCNALDDDCDLAIDEGDDLDGDGEEAPCDCDDTEFAVNSSALEFCDHIDNNCDGRVDEGSSLPTTVRDLVDDLAESADSFGWRGTDVGDLDGDGVVDLAVSSYRDDNANGTDAGSVLIFSGADLGFLCQLVDPDGDTSDRMGASLAGIGDVTGDQIPDIAAGAISDDTRASAAGAVLVFSGADCSLHMRLTDPAGATTDGMGSAVGVVGDLTGDGVPEILAGVDQDDTSSGNDAGSVVVFSGADGSVVFKLSDPNGRQSDRLGSSVVGLGDVNGDGLPDIAAGSFSDDTVAGGGAGSIVVFSGADGTVIRKVRDPQGGINDNLGAAIDRIADLDGDGVDDILAGAPLEDTSGITDGGAALIFSGATGELIRKMVDPARGSSDRLGTSVAALPDIDGDGIQEIIAGVPLDNTSAGSNAGSAVVFSGATGSVLYKLTDPDGAESDEFGRWVAAVPDISGDGAPEVLVGAPGTDRPEGSGGGKVVLISFDSDCDGDGVSPFGLDCDDGDAANYFGNLEVCDAQDNDCDAAVDEDEDGDGFDACSDCDTANPAIYPGAPERCNGLDDDCDLTADEGDDLDGDGEQAPCDCDDADFDVNSSAAEVCDYVDNNCDGQVDESFDSATAGIKVFDADGLTNDNFGQSVADVGDLNGDGITDIAVGSYRDDHAGGTDAGSVLLYSGADLSFICRLLDPNGSTSDRLGASVAGIGDVTGDGVPDIAAGATSEDTRASGAGAILVFSGSTCGFHMRLTDPAGATSDAMGGAVAALDDITGDGVPEILAGVDQDNLGSVGDAGSVVVFNGSDGSVVFKLTDPNGGQSDRLGAAVAGLGDVNGDGTADIAAGSFSDDTFAGGGAGSVVLFSGADGRVIRKLRDPNAGINDNLGASVARIADVDGDGVDDVLAGAPLEDSGISDAGAVLLFSGATGELIRKMVDPARGSSDRLGSSVASIPDLDGDGVAEVVAGTPLDNTGAGSNAGSVTIFSGGTGSVLHKLTDPDGSANDDMGQSVAIIADVSMGGVREIVAGSPGDDSGAGSVVVLVFESDCDSDGQPPLGDCDDSDGGAVSGPSEASGLILSRVAGQTSLDWDSQSSAGSGTTYDVISGALADLVVDGNFASTACLLSQTGEPPVVDPDPDPAAGEGRYYLVRARNGCGLGTFGSSGQDPDPRQGLEDGSASQPSPDPCP